MPAWLVVARHCYCQFVLTVRFAVHFFTTLKQSFGERPRSFNVQGGLPLKDRGVNAVLCRWFRTRLRLEGANLLTEAAEPEP